MYDISSSTHLDMASHSSNYLGFGWFNQLLPHPNHFPVAMVITDVINKRQLPTEIIPAVQHPNQHRKGFSTKSVFIEKN